MQIRRKNFLQIGYKKTEEWEQVKNISNKFYDHFKDKKTQNYLMAQNIPGAKSQQIEKIITPFAESIGFSSQKHNLFIKYKVKKLVPDYYRKVSNTGIIIEVERGQTTQNNSALKDFWKVHICEEADYLFLFVPNILRQNNKGKVQGNPFNETVNRLSTFYEEQNHTNVGGVIIFGY